MRRRCFLAGAFGACLAWMLPWRKSQRVFEGMIKDMCPTEWASLIGRRDQGWKVVRVQWTRVWRGATVWGLSIEVTAEKAVWDQGTTGDGFLAILKEKGFAEVVPGGKVWKQYKPIDLGKA